MRCSLVVPLTLVLAGCAHPLANVKNTTAHYAPSVAASGDVRVAEQHIIAGEKLQTRDSLAAIGDYLRAADSALAQLRQHPGDLDAMRDYNFALARVFSTINKGHIAVVEAIGCPRLRHHTPQGCTCVMGSGQLRIYSL